MFVAAMKQKAVSYISQAADFLLYLHILVLVCKEVWGEVGVQGQG